MAEQGSGQENRGFFAYVLDARLQATKRDSVWDYFKWSDEIENAECKIVDMPCDRYLDLAEPIPYDDRVRHVNLKKKVANGEIRVFNTIPMLGVRLIEDGNDAKVFEHDGRHRVLLMKELGFETVPVLLKAHNFKWGEMPKGKDGKPRPYPDWIWRQNDKSKDVDHVKFVFPVLERDATKKYEKPTD